MTYLSKLECRLFLRSLPGPARLDVHGEEVLVRRRRQREAVVLGRLDVRAREPDPLAGAHLPGGQEGENIG